MTHTTFAAAGHATAHTAGRMPKIKPSTVHRLVVVGGGNEIGPEPALGRHLYRSALFQRSAVYAENLGPGWLLIDARYGLTSPDSLLDPHGCRASEFSIAQERAWSEHVARQLDSLRRYCGADRLEVTLLAGEPYSSWMPLVADWCTVQQPLLGLDLWRRLNWLDAQLATVAKSAGVPS